MAELDAGALPDFVNEESLVDGLAGSISVSPWFSAEECGIDGATGVSIWEVDPDKFQVNSLEVENARHVGGVLLLRFRSNATSKLMTTEATAEISIVGWFGTSEVGSSVLDIESARRLPH